MVENHEDAIRNGTVWKKPNPESYIKRRGEFHSKTNLTAGLVRQIRARAANQEIHLSIAKRFGLRRSGVTSIVSYHTWKHV